MPTTDDADRYNEDVERARWARRGWLAVIAYVSIICCMLLVLSTLVIYLVR
jgi:hypothetical protein